MSVVSSPTLQLRRGGRLPRPSGVRNWWLRETRARAYPEESPVTRGRGQGRPSLMALGASWERCAEGGSLALGALGGAARGPPNRNPQGPPHQEDEGVLGREPQRRPRWVGCGRCSWSGRKGKDRPSLCGRVALDRCHRRCRQAREQAALASPGGRAQGREADCWSHSPPPPPLGAGQGAPCVPSGGCPGHRVPVAGGPLSCQLWALGGLHPQPEPFGVPSSLWLWGEASFAGRCALLQGACPGPAYKSQEKSGAWYGLGFSLLGAQGTPRGSGAWPGRVSVFTLLGRVSAPLYSRAARG